MSIADVQAEAIRGVLDLSKESFKNQTYDLDGEWEFYWEELALPNILPSRNNYIEFPSLWNNYVIEGEEIGSFGYATYHLRVVLPDTSCSYTLHVEDMYCAFNLFINGDLKYTNGVVGKTRDEYRPEWKPDFIHLGPLSDTLDIVLQVSNFDHSKGGASEGMVLGSEEDMVHEERGIVALDLLLTGSLFMGGLFFLGLYLFGHHDKAILFFALFCIAYAYRIIGFGYYVLHALFDIPWWLSVRLEYLALFISAYLFCSFVQNLYPELAKGWLWKALNIICWVFCLIVLITPPVFFTRLVTPFFALLMVYLVLTVRVYYQAYTRRLLGSTYVLISTTVVFVVFTYNIFVYFGLLESMMIATFLGYVLFFFSQSLVLSFRFAYTLKAQKERAEIASQAKSDFLSTISHEIRTPLNAVVGLSHLLLAENPRKDQEESLTSLKYSAEHLTTLINDILDYNKLESGTVEFEEMNVNLKEMSNRILKIYTPKAEAKGLYLKSECDHTVKPNLLLDATRFAQVINNLVDNAIKFTKEGGVTMRMKVITEDQDEQTVRIEVEDTGMGIPADKRELIFQRFTQASSSTTREYGGSGLGLSITRKLLELQGVKIKVDSEVGRGSTFYFIQTFPIGDPYEVEGFVDNVSESTRLAGRSVLLVEDNQLNVMVASKFLSSWGLEYDLASNGREAVEMAENKLYDLVLMDLQMPEMDGYEAAKRIRMQDANIPIIALTASALFRVQDGISKAGMNDFVTKPFDPKELKRKMEKYIFRASRSSAPSE
ncbi:ATP-binding protein [Marinoscillum sp. MHG1-6]|uniref:hybrid sensor histidine kinase/response regulator n=1 Tax=Marinoscillum sp. MHG1-6 TaxID=2959627 RepID=UPI00215708B1|nr:ATP-binding protein [Marinoscillum sp. MHG1-6]